MLRAATVLAALASILGARTFGEHANQTRANWPKSIDLPFAPSAGSAPYVSLGYREMLADMLWIRAIGYVGGDDDRAAGTRALVEAIVALDPRFERVYPFTGAALSALGTAPSEDDLLASIRILERGMEEFPDNCKLPLLAGQVYTVELESDDPEKVQRWQLEGARYLERAVRLQGCPKDVGTFVAHLRTKLGQREKAVRDLRELIAYTDNPKDRQALVDKLAELEERDAAAVAYELEIEKQRFENAWQATRPEVTPTMYLLLGPPLSPSFRLEDLAVDRDLIGSEEPIEPLPPLPD
ncbi:MAG: hypothetical protein F9K40_08480 [Kofleriaceae bacterium]|nr:MAG: hypothetical protein F9K40_08480 [Kofleriaceae bacterium]